MIIPKERIKDILIVLSWGVIYTSIMLHACFSGREFLSELDLLLLFVISVLAGLVLKDMKAIIFGFMGTLLFSVLLMFLVLTLPTLLGYMPYAYQSEFVHILAIRIIFRLIFPAALFICFVGAILGGFFSEKLR